MGSNDARLAIGLTLVTAFAGNAFAQEDKKTDDLKPADPDTGESTVEEATLGLLPNPFEKQGVKFAVTYIGEGLGNPTGGAKQGAVYEDRINFAADVDLEKLIGLKRTDLSRQRLPDRRRRAVARARCSTFSSSAASRRCRRRGSTKSGSRRSGATSSRCGRVSWPPTPNS